jgi:hypothetical protein
MQKLSRGNEEMKLLLTQVLENREEILSEALCKRIQKQLVYVNDEQ